MADSKKNHEFLGGGPRFNAVGGDQASTEETPTAAVKPPGNPLRTAAIVVLALLLAFVLYYMTDNGLGGVAHVSGRGAGVSPSAHQPDANPDSGQGGGP